MPAAARRFRDDEEAGYVNEMLTARGLDPQENEADGWYHAELFVSRPPELVAAQPLKQLLAPVAAARLRLEPV